MLLLQATEEATGEFSILGSLVAIALIAAMGYAAYWSWTRAGNTAGIKMWFYRAAAGFTATIALIGIVAFLMNLGAAVGLL